MKTKAKQIKIEVEERLIGGGKIKVPVTECMVGGGKIKVPLTERMVGGGKITIMRIMPQKTTRRKQAASKKDASQIKQRPNSLD